MIHLEGVWTYQSQDTPPPTEGGMRSDDVSTVWLHRIDDDGYDRSIEFAATPAPPFDILVRDSDGHSRRWTVESSVDHGDFIEGIVSVVSGSAEHPTKGSKVLIQYLDSADAVLPVPPTLGQSARLTQAIIAKATRILVMTEAPLGSWGEITDFGIATVRPDYQIKELLYGLHVGDWELSDLSNLVEVDDVIRAGLQADPVTFPAERVPDVQRAIDAAVDWIHTDLVGAFGVA